MLNNTVTLIGNIGAEARILEQEGKRFASLSIATTDSYKDADGQWQQKEPVWHQVLIFNPKIVEMVKSLKTGTRIEVTGSLSYRPFNTTLDNGLNVQKMEASIIAQKLELKPLYKKPAA